jgi:L-alanine-DL-glutamate epimerase-like enolase superfamily enzyme
LVQPLSEEVAMKIADLTVELFVWRDLGGTNPAYGVRLAETQLGLLRILTDDGIEGHAFLGSAVQSADLDAPGLVRHLKPLLIGRDPLSRERLVQEMWSWKRRRLTTIRAIGAVDVALWDIAGKVAGMPIHQLLGNHRNCLPAYASSQVLPNAAGFAEEAAQFRAKGWTAYKIHPPQEPEEDIRVCEAVRAAVGDGFTLMLDSMWSYDFITALRVGAAIEALGFAWFEDPLAENDIYNYAKLREKLHIPLMATEYPEGGLDGYAPWIMQRATDYLRGDVAVKGGITTIVKAAHLAEAFGLRFSIHHGANSLANVANLHVGMAIPNCDYFEVLLPDRQQKYGLVRDIEVDSEGMVHAPAGPGLGAEIDFDLIDRNRLATLR